MATRLQWGLDCSLVRPPQEVRWGLGRDLAPVGHSPLQHTFLLALADTSPIQQRLLDRCGGYAQGVQPFGGGVVNHLFSI
jgi:hypothetical protein